MFFNIRTDSEVLKLFLLLYVGKRHIFEVHALRFGSKAMRELVYIQSEGDGEVVDQVLYCNIYS